MILMSVGAARAVGVPGQGSWETTLQARDIDKDGVTDAFYDTALNITWLRASRYEGMPWSAAKAWAEQDRFGLSGWRLPKTKDTGAPGCDLNYTGGTDCGFNPDSSVATGSEWAHLFYQSLGNKGLYAPGTRDAQAGFGLSNTGNFLNLNPDGIAWSGTEYAPEAGSAWYFEFQWGVQHFMPKDNRYSNVMAVRDGDVAAAVPEPQTYVMLLMGLVALPLVRRRKST